MSKLYKSTLFKFSNVVKINERNNFNKKNYSENNFIKNNVTETLKKIVTRFQQFLEKNEKESLFYTGLRFKQILILLTKSNCDSKMRLLTPLQELIIVLVRLRCGLLLEDMAYRFRISVGLLSSITTTWIQFMYREFTENLRPKMFASREQVQKHVPLIFKQFKNLPVIIDCTEFFCESPGNFEHQGNVYSSYKSHTTFKVLIGCTPNGGIGFVSDVYEGSISDREIVIQSKLADYLIPGDVVLADKGFTIQNVVEQIGAHLNIPPFLRNRDRFTAQEEIAKKK
ncbi:uncharacterized protein LOC127287500 [Leptopilina boulardi]|uniref:uncharacterized protein LOC127287500 n=1 Tax=Leptopilina boulardi TaxID=63433 RepID=UPI0021F65BAC|nr:uncharacterized protein LOC127287500 [Leptopilina boulardi]